MYPSDLDLVEELADQPSVIFRGGSAIISPLGQPLTGPLYDQEGILLAKLDMAEVVQARYDFDPVGHYSRPDVFQLLVNERSMPPVAFALGSEFGSPLYPTCTAGRKPGFLI